MLEKLYASPTLENLLENFSKYPTQWIDRTTQSSLAALCAYLQKKNQTVVFITQEKKDALFVDLHFFTSHVVEFPSWETLPGEEIPPSLDLVGQRMESLHQLMEDNEPKIILTNLSALLQKIPSHTELHSKIEKIQKGQTLSFDTFPQKLIDLGYRREAVVSDKGQFAVRGGIIDVFPITSSDPYRIDFFADEIDQIKSFDPVGQKSITGIEQFLLTPADELQLLKDAHELVSLFSYLKDPILLFNEIVTLEDTWVSLKKSLDTMPFGMFSFEEWFQKTHSHRRLLTTKHPKEKILPHAPQEEVTLEFCNEKIPCYFTKHPFRNPTDYLDIDGTAEDFTSLLRNADELRSDVLFIYSSEKRKELLEEYPLPKKHGFKKGLLAEGLIVADQNFALLPESMWTNKKPVRRQKWRNTYHTPAAEFHQLSPGDLVVHFHSGIGKYLGVEKRKDHLGQETEFMLLEYADQSRLFVPLSQSHLVSRYIGSSESVPSLSLLGSKKWQNAKMTAQKQIIGYAKDLLEKTAEREVHGGTVYGPDSEDMQLFESDFPYIETQDQLKSIQDIKLDMQSKKAMDRLICGDVGYGKTEVAMRAAFKAVVDGQKQVAVLVPTTVLAIQHYENFLQRMQGYPVLIDILSRNQTKKQQMTTLRSLKEGTADIVIGTHRLLSKDIAFQRLGLIVIDEEQRFGVRAKEHLKHLKKGVDCLTLSATPIPRTLYMALVHARDMSVINTPPQDRLPIKTILSESDDTIIENAIHRELARNGQVFFIHNRVETIYKRAKDIQKLIPTAKCGIVHGQMDAEEADRIFHGFKQGFIDILFATTILENGVDVPNANTILIDRADQFGVADLYQLRGRVGRSNRMAYAYFLIPKNQKLREESRKRLHALIESTGFGGGMKIAMRDLEIRGAGDILGTQQSGHVSSIGFHLYCKLLKRTIQSMQKNLPTSFAETKIEFPFSARFPDYYIEEPSLRMELYHRLGEAQGLEEIDMIFDEIKDRFGEPPTEAVWLYHFSRIRTYANQNHFSFLKYTPNLLTAERKKGKTVQQEKLPLPKISNPKDLEEVTFGYFKERFINS